MSVIISRDRCIGCGRCVEVCPGNLIWKDEDGRAVMRIPEDCWGCTGCVKACPAGAIGYYLGADIGGRGAVMTVESRGQYYDWKIRFPDGKERVLTVDRKSSNRY